MRAAARLCGRVSELRRRFYDEVRRLDKHPVTAEIAVEGGGTVTWVIDGGLLLDEAAFFAGFPDLVVDMPSVADYLANGNVLEWVSEIVLEPPAPINDFIAEARTSASGCRDSFAHQTNQMLQAARAKAPLMKRFFGLGQDRRLCSSWRVGRSDPNGYGYIDSDLPVLTLRAEWDLPSVDAGRIMKQARHFQSGWAYSFPNRGHGLLHEVFGQDATCARAIAMDFLADPRSKPDADCVAEIAPTHFNVYESASAASIQLSASRATRPMRYEVFDRP